MIISASRRTDIPAFYSEWFINRIRAGFVMVANPFNRRQVRRVSLQVEDVEAIVFWTRDAGPLLPYLSELDSRGYRYYVHYTITGYPAAVEASVPGLSQAISCFCELNGHVGAERVLWRYDPILLCNLVGITEHKRRFAEIAAALQGKTRRVSISFTEFYRKTKKNLCRVKGLVCSDITANSALMRDLVTSLAGIAESYDMELRTCATAADMVDVGVTGGKCIDEQLLKETFGIAYPPHKDKGQRSSCRCVQSIDIGQYNTCQHGCVYCYATSDSIQASANKARHDPESPLLIGQPPQKTVTKSKQYTLF